jgi:hypothetical protein
LFGSLLLPVFIFCIGSVVVLIFLFVPYFLLPCFVAFDLSL